MCSAELAVAQVIRTDPTTSKGGFPVPSENCGHRMLDSELTVQGITDLVSRNPNRSRDPGSFMCCLPNSVLANIAAANSSFAGQPGTPNDPRVFAFGRNAKGEPAAVFSMNGGHPGMPGGRNVEAMVNEDDQVVLLDIDFSTTPPTVTRNPEFCLSCHGTPEGLPGGPRTIFEPFNNWTSFVNAIDPPCNDDEEAMQRAAGRKNQTVMAAKNVFRCLNNRNLTKVPGTFDVSKLDGFTRDLNSRRVANIILATRDYQKYKYAILGSTLCNEDAANFISDWLPASTIGAHNASLNLRREIVVAEGRMALNQIVQAQYRRDRLFADGLRPRQRELASNPSWMNSRRLPIANARGSCMSDAELSERPIPTTTHVSDTYMKYMADTLVRARRGDNPDPTLRFLFEARGIGMEDWGMGPTPGDYGSTQFDLSVLVNREPEGSSIRELMTRHQVSSEGVIPKANKVAFCNSLKQLSLTALGGPARVIPTSNSVR